MKASTSKPSPSADRHYVPSLPNQPRRREKNKNMIDGHPQRSVSPVFLLGFLDPAACTAAAGIMTTPALFCGDCVKIFLGVLGGLARGDYFRTPASPLPATENPITPKRKERLLPAALWVHPVYVLNYLLILRRMTIAKAPRPNRLIVAGSGTAGAS